MKIIIRSIYSTNKQKQQPPPPPPPPPPFKGDKSVWMFTTYLRYIYIFTGCLKKLTIRYIYLTNKNKTKT